MTADYDIELRNVVKEFPTRSSEGATRAVDSISLQIMPGEFFALLGPSGCGKTTTLRMIAGFEEATSGDILLRGKPMRGVPPFHRPVNTVFQDYALFPHMTVLQNVMFGLEMENVSRAEAEKRAKAALELVRLTQFDRRPRQLSGGQQQRVALARALVKRPAVLLLDEPLGALDLKLRKAMQYELMTMQNDLNMTFIYVTHDQEEALTMADRIAVMDKGKVLQVGSPEEIYETPSTRFVADFIGETNFVEGRLIEKRGYIGIVALKGADCVVEAELGTADPQIGDNVTVAVRPEKITLLRLGDEDDHLLSVPAAEIMAAVERETNKTLVEGVVQFANYIGTDTRYIVRIGGSIDLVVRVQNFGERFDTLFHKGERVNVFWATDTARILVE
ncbi:MAG: spermidine/putrescine ABC transporter ATP-binding protein [Phototrophicales bacterium]|nr:MAG: spermidine/putrescine ABC transporter ATP-binding protein [Phototrophicales bacterium]